MTSTAMIWPAATALAASTAASPTAPVPNTAMLAPAGTRSVFITVPAPVWRPHPRGPASSSGISLSSLTTFRSAATE